MELLANRQETKNAKETCWTPRNYPGDFEIILALFPEGRQDGVRTWRFKKTTLKGKTIQ
jgi:hypothetical protein